ncbi:carboxymuconolactone decarboxylase family protein [Parasalinivibrio latis]|uniref:carboxymuconolactone decarboxylase family protein n=1 Tax=Parasalinivibrio latis TaxID=2952610 RepID=UPI0032442887
MFNQHRLNYAELDAESYKLLYDMEIHLESCEISDHLKTLIKLKASMINKCAFCIQMHTQEGHKAGLTEQQMFAVAAWEESPLFGDTERAVLALTEEVTLVSEHGISEVVYQQALALLGEKTLAQCITQIVTINVWNRIALATRMYFENQYLRI